MFALGVEGAKVRQFVSAADEAEALTHALPDEVAVAFAGAVATGGEIRGGSVVFPAPSPATVLAKAWQGVRDKRNALLNQMAWTYRTDSPLNADCQTAWVTWAKTLNRITVDYDDPAKVVWPVEPTLEYAS